MGLNIGEIILRKEISLSDLKGKTVAIDAFNAIYQFLTTIRQIDGTPLMDSKKKITSHLSGLFYRNINLLEEGIKPIYVFDGKPVDLKREENKARAEVRKEAQEKYEEAKKEENVEEMRKYSAMAVSINNEIIEESKELLEALGIPVIQALGEGEAEAAHLSRTERVWTAASQDYDALLFGANRLVRNLTLARKRKTVTGYVEVKPELIEFESLLNHLGINREQLICLGILVGTDFNPGGVKGIGQKRALEIVRKYEFPVKIFEYISSNEKYVVNFDWQDVFHIFNKPDCCQDSDLTFRKVDKKRVKEILLSREFSEERIDNALVRLEKVEEKKKQKTLF